MKWDEKVITDFSDKNISEMYECGYLFTRIGKGVMQQTRSVRIDLGKFEPTSENKRILRRVGGVDFHVDFLPMRNYDWKIGKMAKDFYETRFGPDIVSANKIKDLLSDNTKSGFNTLLKYSVDSRTVGYAICYENKEILHYSYPFYDLQSAPKNMGLWMMNMAIQYSHGLQKKFVYLGSLQRPTDIYKLQFKGLEWFDGKEWSGDLEKVKKILASDSINE